MVAQSRRPRRNPKETEILGSKFGILADMATEDVGDQHQEEYPAKGGTGKSMGILSGTKNQEKGRVGLVGGTSKQKASGNGLGKPGLKTNVDKEAQKSKTNVVLKEPNEALVQKLRDKLKGKEEELKSNSTNSEIIMVDEGEQLNTLSGVDQPKQYDEGSASGDGRGKRETSG